MARSNWILPRADAACGKVFHLDRQSAEGYRIGLQFWNQATGRNQARDHLVTFRCRRCGGFHVARKSSKAPAVEKPPAFAATA
ncbi:MAG: hypothetical protein ACXVBG_13795 [Isosphaeraceae bacterium]